ncbi:MAG: MmgE/PrpD family protein, partial [Pirellulaceae bacterium]
MDKQNDSFQPQFAGVTRRSLLRGALAISAVTAAPSIATAHSLKQESASADEAAGFTRKLAKFVSSIPSASIPAEQLEYAKIIFLDTIGCAVASSSEPLVTRLLAFSDKIGGEEQSRMLIANKSSRSATHAALIGGAAAHAMDFDDTTSRFWGHPSASIVPSLMAIAEMKGSTGREILDAYLIGLEASFVVADSVGEAMYASGFHNTSSLGIIASGAACARLLGLDQAGASDAIAVAATQAFGLKRSFGTMCKPFHAGRAAEGAVTAALLAEDGFTGADDIFEGPNGLFEAFGGEADVMPLASLGKKWGVYDVLQKAHAACQWTHSPINAAEALKQEHKIDFKNIKSVEVLASEIALSTADVVVPETGLKAKFSVPYGVATALVTGKTGLAAFTDDAVKNTEILDLISKITTVAHPKAEKFEAKVTITMNSGETYEAFNDVFGQFPSLEDKRKVAMEKYLENTAPILGEAKVKRVADVIMRLETAGKASEILD